MRGTRLPQVLLGVAAVALAAVWAAPLALRGKELVLVWWALAALAILCLAVQGLAWARLQRRLASEVPPLQPGTPADIDFDRPWKGGAS